MTRLSSRHIRPSSSADEMPDTVHGLKTSRLKLGAVLKFHRTPTLAGCRRLYGLALGATVSIDAKVGVDIQKKGV
jgi:hypothetical protein